MGVQLRHAGARRALLWLAALAGLLPVTARAQPTGADTTRTRQVQIVHADSLVGQVVDGETVRRLVGRVHLRQGETLLWADRAVQYPAREEIHFTGHVRIVDRGDSLWADRVLYRSDTKTGTARGTVRLSDGDVLVFAPSGRYLIDEKQAFFDETVRLVDSLTVLQSQAGAYDTEAKRADFFGAVRLEEPRTYLEADSVTYFRDTDVSLARGTVFVERLGGGEGIAEADTTTRTLLFGEQVYHDERSRTSRVEGNPLLVQLRTDSTGAPADTLLMRAALLLAAEDDTLRRLTATGAVEVWQRDFAAAADSVVYDRREREDVAHEESRLFGTPAAWFEETQVRGDTLRIVGRDGAVDSLFAGRPAFVAQLDSVLGRVQQLRGQQLVGVFVEDSLRLLTVGPNAEAIRFMEDAGRPDGGVRLSGDRITFRFHDDEVERVSVYEGVEGTYYPEHLLPEPFRLDGYRYDPDARPALDALLREERVRRRLDEVERPFARRTERTEDGG